MIEVPETMRHFTAIITFLFLFGSLSMTAHNFSDTSFYQKQLSFDRVKEAMAEKELGLQEEARAAGFSWPPTSLFIRIFKFEARLEVWAQKENSATYSLFKHYEICELSGVLGPKRKQGDEQMPEGFYQIAVFNPLSSYHLSLGLNYPNESDRILSDPEFPGGDIYIHGDCVTIGCFPMTDDKIKEIYVLAFLAKASGQENIPVHVFPAYINDKGFGNLSDYYKSRPDLIQFWQQLKMGFDFFEKQHRIPDITVDEKGNYHFN